MKTGEQVGVREVRQSSVVALKKIRRPQSSLSIASAIPQQVRTALLWTSIIYSNVLCEFLVHVP
jgi:hypothetical protein